MSCKITPLSFFSSNVKYFAQKEPIKVEILKILSVQVKIPQILVIFETINQFFSNFASLFSAMRNKSSIIFYVKFYILLKKRVYQSTNLVKFHVSSQKSNILHFDGFLLSYRINCINFQLKKTEELSLVTLKSDAKIKEKLTYVFKYDMRNLVNFHPTTQKSEFFFSIGSFCPNYTRFKLQKYVFHTKINLSCHWIMM